MWEVIDHTADLALEARGATGEEALRALLEGLLSQITDVERVEPLRTVEIEAEGLDREETLVSALGEVLYWVNVRGWLFSEFRVRELGDRRVRLQARGQPRDPARHPFHKEIKAATYHDLVFSPAPDGSWAARVVFDV